MTVREYQTRMMIFTNAILTVYFYFFRKLNYSFKKKKNDLISFLTLTIEHLSQNFKLCQEFEINLFSFKIVTTTTSTTTTTTTRTTTTISTTTTSTTSTTKTCKKNRKYTMFLRLGCPHKC